LGLGGGIRTYYRWLSILRDKSRAIKAADVWVMKDDEDHSVRAENRATGYQVKVPKKAISPSLRRHSGVGYIDISKATDYVIVDNFEGIERFISEDALLKKFRRDAKLWRQYVETRLCALIILRKFDFSASGTSVFAFYSDLPAAPGDLWGMAGLEADEARILAAWYNSTPNLLQMFLNRTETRGAWMKIDASALRQSYVLNYPGLQTSEKRELLSIMKRMAATKSPSILNQLNNHYDLRRELDEAILEVLGFGQTEVNRILKSMYPRLASEINMLKDLMEGGDSDDSEDDESQDDQ